jgi:hypothetical protein
MTHERKKPTKEELEARYRKQHEMLRKIIEIETRKESEVIMQYYERFKKEHETK